MIITQTKVCDLIVVSSLLKNTENPNSNRNDVTIPLLSELVLITYFINGEGEDNLRSI